jgi:3-hydroxyisobutyrate dehydrogenase-like beta-hydroxyacid dehydrogenase
VFVAGGRKIGVTDSHARRADAPTVAVVGCGRMGMPMAERLLSAGIPVRAFDSAEPARRAAAESGAIPALSPAAAASGADVVITMLPSPAAVSSAATAEDGILAGLRPGALWLEMSSSSPDVTRELAGAVEAAGAELLDAPVSGGPAGARAGTLTLMLGGPGGRVERGRAVVEHLGERLVHVGDRPGDGDVAKTVNNMLSATNLAAAAEALALGMRAGLTPERLLDCINGGSGASHASRVKLAGHVLTGRFCAGFTIGEYLKDLHIAQETAAEHRVATPVNAVALAVWTGLAARASEQDHTRVADLVVRDAGLRPDWNASPPRRTSIDEP